MAPFIAFYLVLLTICFVGAIPKACHEFFALRFAIWPAAVLSIASSWIEFILGVVLGMVVNRVNVEWIAETRLLVALVPAFFVFEGALRIGLNHRLPATVPTLLTWLPYRLWLLTRT